MNRDALLRLAFGALSPATVDRLVARHGSETAAVAAITRGRTQVSPGSRTRIGVPAPERRSQLKELGVRFVSRSDGSYPHHLRRFPDPPRWLFVKGSVPDGPSIAIVGSRSATTYGLDLAYRYGAAAASGGWHVISGLARGIDAAAHRGAIEGAGRGCCVGVLGCGIDVTYPKANRDLYIDVLMSHGGLVSEFPPGTRPDAWRFPTRNRIIAGLADVVLVVEASERGGALITARIALDYGVPVHAVPGDIDRETSKGTNALIRDGAFPVFDAEDLVTVLQLLEPVVARLG